MGSDCDNAIRIKADQQLAEIDKKYPGFIQVCVVFYPTAFKASADIAFTHCVRKGA